MRPLSPRLNSGSAPGRASRSPQLFWYALEALLASVAGWPLSWRSLPAWIIRDLLLPVLWSEAWAGDSFVWRGNAMSVDEAELREAASGPPPSM